MNMQSLRLSWLAILAMAIAPVTFLNSASADIVNVASGNLVTSGSVDQKREIIAKIFGCGSMLTESVPLDYVIQPLPPERTPFHFYKVSQKKVASNWDMSFEYGFDSVPAEEFVFPTESLADGSERKSPTSMPMMGNSSRRDSAFGAKSVSFRMNLKQPDSLSVRPDLRMNEMIPADAAFKESLVLAHKSYLEHLLAEHESQRRRTEWLANALTIGLSTALAFSVLFVAILFRSLAKKQIQQ